MYECVAENGNGDPVSVEAELTVYDGEKLHVVSSEQSDYKPNTSIRQTERGCQKRTNNY